MVSLGIRKQTPLGIYVHVPFCRSRCQYCDFYSIRGDADKSLMERYVDAVCLHLKEAGSLSPNYQVDSIYFGGGTPSYLGAEGLTRILDAIHRRFSISPDAEVSIEANPESVDEKFLRQMMKQGVNRLSMGLQNDNDQILHRLGRCHNYRQAVEAMEAARNVGLKNVSLDLIYGLPDQSLSDWEKTLEHVLELNPEHMSCYALKIEEGTPMWEQRASLRIPDDDVQADMYLSAVRILQAQGYAQYEISNFARRGLRCRHNLKYWVGGEYLGFGPAASSDFAGKRFTIDADLKSYIEGIHKNGPVLRECEEIPRQERAGEYLMLRLRTTQGIQAQEYTQRFLLPFEPIAERMQVFASRGLAAFDGDRWHFTPQGFLISNSLIIELLEAQEKSIPLAKRR